MNYKSPSLTVDGVIIKNNKILLVKRKNEPYKNRWVLPGGFVEYGEKVEEAVMREVNEETGLNTKIKKLIGVYSNPNRDPRGHTVSIVYILEIIDGGIKAGDDAIDVDFFGFKNLPELGFDHEEIIKDVRREKNVLPKM